MNEMQPLVPHGKDIPRTEPWMLVMMLAFVPVIGIFVLPDAANPYCLGAAGVLAAIGLGLPHSDRDAPKHTIVALSS